MIIVEPMKAAHLASLTVQAAQHVWRNNMTEEHFKLLAAPDAAWSVFEGERLMMCAGVIDAGEGRGEAWALLAPDCGRAMTGITRAVRRYLHATPFRRIEAAVAENFAPGSRWAKMLGFRFEGLMTSYLDDGSNAERWARVK